MVEPKLWILIKKLLEGTDGGSVIWEKTVARTTFQTAFPKFSVRLTETEGEQPNEPDYAISIFDETGRLLERINDVELAKVLKSQGNQEIPFVTMKDLYTKARRKALGVEEAVDSILKSIDDNIPF